MTHRAPPHLETAVMLEDLTISNYSVHKEIKVIFSVISVPNSNKKKEKVTCYIKHLHSISKLSLKLLNPQMLISSD